MVVRRLAVVAAGVVFSAGLAIAREPLRANPSERPSNWTAPPYWTPSETARDGSFETLPQESGEVGLEPLGALPSSPLPFTAITPCRIVDTRGANGSFGGPALVANATRTFNLPSGPCAGIPVDAGAYSLNLTIIGGSGVFTNAFLTAWATGDTQPVVSTLNFNANQLEANAAVVPAGTSGSINVFVNASGNLLIDINGYYRAIPIVNTVNGLSGAVTLGAGSNISITPAGQTLTIANTAPAGWSLTGNAGTTAGTNFLGTTDAQPLELKVNGERALRVEPDPFPGTYGPNMIGGFLGNSVTAGKVGGAIGGGGQVGLTNRVTGDFGTVGGGWNNEAAGYAAVVGGGRGNTASGNQSTLGAGQENTAGGDFATVPGGSNNSAGGSYSLAAGRRAKASHSGTFVWGDATNADISSTSSNQFIARATGGFAFVPAPGVGCALTDVTGWHCGSISDRNVKESVASVDVRAMLDRLIEMPIHVWSYKGQSPGIRHLGPMAQDFAAAYGLGPDDKTINPLDANGVALAAIQGLYDLVKEKDAEIEALKTRLSRLEAKIE
jgi:Chaperone of endosialidase